MITGRWHTWDDRFYASQDLFAELRVYQEPPYGDREAFRLRCNSIEDCQVAINQIVHAEDYGRTDDPEVEITLAWAWEQGFSHGVRSHRDGVHFAHARRANPYQEV